MSTETLGIGSRVSHPQYGAGVVIQVSGEAYEITFIEHGTKQILRSFEGLEIIEAADTPADSVSWEKVEKSMIRILRRFTDLQENIPLGNKWSGGKVLIQPGDPGLQGKEIPIDGLFHKIVMVRDRLRVMEAKINASNLSDEEKVELQQYITRIYGSLTTFNVLFRNKEDYFVGEKS